MTTAINPVEPLIPDPAISPQTDIHVSSTTTPVNHSISQTQLQLPSHSVSPEIHNSTSILHASKSPKRSYKDCLISDKTSSIIQLDLTQTELASPINFSETHTQTGSLTIDFPPKLTDRLREPWKFTLIAKPLGKSTGFRYFDQKIRHIWKPIGEIAILDLGRDFFAVRFKNPEDHLRILTGGPWFINKSLISIRNWCPFFNAFDAKASTTTVWIRLPGLPLEFYDQEALSLIGNRIGKLISIDARTANTKRGRFARLCIELDITRPLPTSIQLDGHHQNVGS